MTHDHPDWPPQSTGAGTTLRLVHALGRPGRPRRAALLLLGFMVSGVLFVVLLLLLGS